MQMSSFSRSPAEVSATAARWLRADARDVLRVQPVESTPALAPARPERGATRASSSTLLAGLGVWRARLSRRRALVVVRRRLLVALGLGVALELIGLAAGAGTQARATWLIAPALLAVGGVVAALRERPRVAEVARLLDHELGLAERVGTALELESQAPRPDSVGGVGLPALVDAEAAAAVSRSLGGAHAVLAPAWAERSSLGALAVALALLLVLPTSGAGVRRGSAANQRPVPVAKAGAHAAVGSGAKRSPASTRRSAAAQSSGGRRAPLHFGSAPAPAGAGRELARGPSSGKPSASAPHQLAKAGSGEVAPRAGASAGQSAASAGASAAARSSGAPGGRAGRGASSAGGSGRAGASRGAGAAASGARPGAGASNAPGKAGAAAGASSPAGAFRGRHAPPGGESAGGARGSTAQPLHPPAAKLGIAGAGLPIQPGYTPSRSASGGAGSGPPLAGGLGPARGANVRGAAGSGGASFPYIPPTPSATTSFDDGLLLSYFAPFSPLPSATWS